LNNLLILSTQTLVALAVFSLIYKVYLREWFNAQAFGTAVLPLLFLHCFRYLGLSMLVTGQMAPEVSRDALHIMAYGDFAAGIAALLAVLAVLVKSKLAPMLVLLFSVVGIGDLIVIGPTAYNGGVFAADIGTMWFLLVLYAPTLLLSHIYIAYRLVMHYKSHSKTL
jgi:hypothetical protein